MMSTHKSGSLVRRLAEERKAREAAKARTYIVHEDDQDGPPSMVEFKGTWRQLLVHVSRHYRTKAECSASTDAELLADAESANGDGQPYTSVWCVEDRKRVL